MTTRDEDSGSAAGLSDALQTLIRRLRDAANCCQSNADYGAITTSVGEQQHLTLLLRRAADELAATIRTRVAASPNRQRSKNAERKRAKRPSPAQPPNGDK